MHSRSSIRTATRFVTFGENGQKSEPPKEKAFWPFNISEKVLSGLHGQDVVHCDVKLENILVATASTFRAKLTDFGTSYFVGRPPFEAFQRQYKGVRKFVE
jgi:serine/threonine protein kinase